MGLGADNPQLFQRAFCRGSYMLPRCRPHHRLQSMNATIPDEMRHELRDLFGEPRQEREIRIIFATNKPPHVDVEGMTERSISVILTEDCKNERLRYDFQLAHELVHTLDPIRHASVLEEGCATYFQHHYIRKFLPASHTSWHWPELSDSNRKYAKAHELVRPIFETDMSALKRLRNGGHGLSLNGADALASAIPFLGIKRAQALVQKFESWTL